MERTQKIALLDYVGARVIIRTVSHADEDAALEVAHQEGVHLDDCEWMGGELKLDIEEPEQTAADRIPRVNIYNMTGKSGREVPNQYIIETEHGAYFKSYQSIIAYRPYCGGKIVLDRGTWDYSTTTGKYRNEFLRESVAETRRKIEEGIYELADLNQSRI